MDASSPIADASGTGGAARKLQFRRMTHHRKRAVTACEPCRVRKAKCTNERPVCQPCVKLGTQCSYEQRTNHSSFDPASLLIIEKLNQVLSRLDNNKDEPPIPSATAGELQQSRDVQPDIEEEIYFCSSFTSTDSVISWPIFEGELVQVSLGEETFIKDYERTKAFDKEYSEGTRTHRASICEDDIPKYIDNFLRFVHCKNPILHTGTLKQYATSVVENGPGWDAVSCLVLIACALGAIATPFENLGSDSRSSPGDTSSLSDNTAAKIIAENFYQLACRRLGLLNRSIIACQCQLLCGIYQMYTMRPLDGWNSFSRASTICALYLKGGEFLRQRSGNVDEDREAFTSQCQSHQRLYWTCIKSECELRSELNLPTSELAMLPIPDTLPSPPTFSNPPNETQHATGLDTLSATPTSTTPTLPTHSPTQQQVEEQSWFYYLSELALLRIESRVTYQFYRESNDSWLRADVREMISLAEDFELQLQNWLSMLPTSIRLQDSSASASMNELQYVAHGRYVIVRALVYRPFLYLMIHKHNMSSSESNMIRPFAEKALHSPLRMTSLGPAYHRHHGTWLACRTYIRGALMLYAGIKAGLIGEEGLREAKQGLETCLLTLKYWQEECPDFGMAVQLVELILSKII
ncbi:unnamed protein product [Clonostachys rosea]|uniref:Zn(2)-C6 fungal-type domain-containing protein n=1 Tax=Bionectria ochroleuca TaxID=29856 RepID=A0ABY6TZ34_BIOOC|nr:unnamed protein product [Clonostachys rosea]